MRLVIQRVSRARVTVDGEQTGAIDRGLLVFVGIGEGDGEVEVRWAADKIAGLRVFEDEAGKMNLPVAEAAGSVLLVSQFTLYGDCRKGRRPAFTRAAPPDEADRLYHAVASALRLHGLTVETGRFQAHMEVELVNDGPVTLLLDSSKAF